MEKLVILPTYNEKENIESILAAIFGLQQDFHVLVIDDGSPDGTALIVKNLQVKYPGQLFIEERKGKLGLGTAYIHGFKWALAKGYQFIFEIDADFSHNPADLPRLCDTCKKDGADLAIGSRYVKGGGVINWPWENKYLAAVFHCVFGSAKRSGRNGAFDDDGGEAESAHNSISF